MRNYTIILCLMFFVQSVFSQNKGNVSGEHGMLNIKENFELNFTRNQSKDAQWFGESENSFGLFIHWSICSVKKMNISWVMIAARSWESPLAKKHITDSIERKRIIDQKDYYLDRRAIVTPNEYWEQAKMFNPSNFSPEKWAKAASEAGIKYLVFTCRHHDGFAMWPSKYGEFGTKTYLNSRDFVADYVKACRKYKLKVGFYYSPPDWYFDREYKNFLDPTTARRNPEFPMLDANIEPRKIIKTEAQIIEHQKAYKAYIKGQVEELLTNYGKIDLLWFDGSPFPDAKNSISIDRIRALQPGIVVNPRLHGHGDFKTFERDLTLQKPDASTWYEFCNPWCPSWVYMDQKPRDASSVLGELVRCKSLGINYLLDVGPMADGNFQPEIYQGLNDIKNWINLNNEAINNVQPIPSTESASVLATASKNKNVRYLFLLTKFSSSLFKSFKENIVPPVDEVITIENVTKPAQVKLLKSNTTLEFTYENKTLKIIVPKSFRTSEIDVVKVNL